MSFPISRYLNIQNAFYPAFTGDGRALAFLSDITGVYQAWQVNLAQGVDTIPWPEQLTFAPDRVLQVYYSPVAGDRRLLYAHDMGGNENAQLFLLDLVTGQENCLTTGYEQAMHIPGEWSADGSRLLFAANRRHPDLFDLYVQPLDGRSLDGRAAQQIWQNEAPGFLFESIWGPGETVIVLRAASAAQVDILQIDLAQGTVRELDPADQAAWFGSLNMSADGRTLFLLTDLAADFKYAACLDLATLAISPLVAPAADVELLTLAPDGRSLAYSLNQDGTSALALLDLPTGVTRRPAVDDVPGVIGWYDGRLVFTPDSRQLAFSYTSATHASDIYLWDLHTDDVTAVTHSSHGGLPPHTFVTPRLVHYPTFDDRSIPAWYYQPPLAGKPHAAPLPTIIIVHGGPESQFRPYFHFLAQYLTHHGFAVLGPNVRGSTGYGKSYMRLDNVENRMDAVADLAHAAYWLKQQPGIDPDRIVVYGGSYGGFMVLAALTHYPDLWAAGVNIVGISNFVTFLENTSGYRRPHREAEYGSLAKDRDFLERIAPINHIEKLTAPLMVIHGANDPRVPLSEAEQLVAALQSRDVPVKFLVYHDEGHGIVKLKNKRSLYPQVVAFLQEVLAT